MNYSPPLRLHAIVLALNEEIFIENQLRTLYPFCTGISVLTQYDRDWYGKPVTPDRTLELVANYPDPEGKVHLVLRRWRDQAAALNCEMDALSGRPFRGVVSHGTPENEIREFHARPDYFWIVDADEFYDPETLPNIIERLATRRPRAMRVNGYNYLHTWNQRVPIEAVRFCQFGFVHPKLRFESIRQITFNEGRVSKLCRIVRVPDMSSYVFGFDECPVEVGVFHHGCWVGGTNRLQEKRRKSAHTWMNTDGYVDNIEQTAFEWVPYEKLPRFIRKLNWPKGYIKAEPTADDVAEIEKS